VTSFADGTRELERMIGNGDLVMKVEVSQIYAASQHEGGWVTGPLAGHVIKHHPQGGQAHFLSEPLFARAPEFMELLAAHTLEPDGLLFAGRDIVEELSKEVFDKAPREFEDLRNSAHPTVIDDGQVRYDRPPVRDRLSKEALKEKGKRRRAGEGPAKRTKVAQ
jgi:hypothetical protein